MNGGKVSNKEKEIEIQPTSLDKGPGTTNEVKIPCVTKVVEIVDWYRNGNLIA